MENLGTYKPRRLPHWDYGNKFQSISYRLADSISKTEEQRILYLMGMQPPQEQEYFRRSLIEEYLHQNRTGCCILSNPIAAKLVIDAWYFYNGKLYDLYDWVVMSNHVHLIIYVYDKVQLGTIVGRWKSYSGRMINQKLSIPTPVWHKEYCDREIRNEEHFQKCRAYILNNPNKAGLHNWSFISTRWHKQE